jgi:ABC-type branched-subunit amino acid transport system permease subunit
MGIIGWIVLGLIAGAVAKAILPGDDPGGIIVTMLIVGGMGSVSGAVAGTVLITAAFEALRAVENEVNASDLLPRAFSGFTEVMLATAMIVLLVRRPAGITGGNELRLPRRWGRRARDERVSGVGGEAPGSEGREGTAP